MIRQTIQGNWKLRACNTDQWFPAQIPGSVLQTMISNGQCRHPYEKDYEYEVREIFRKDYEFAGAFSVAEEVLEESQVTLVFYGLDTLAEISINGKMLGQTNNMHRIWRFSCKEMLRPGENTMQIVFRSPIEYVESIVPEEGKEITMVNTGTMYGSQYLRKSHSMFGWDWGAQLPDMGIWRNIELEAFSSARIEEVEIVQEHQADCVCVKVKTQVEALKKQQIQLQVVIEAPDGSIVASDSTEQEKTEEIALYIDHPKLWWPNGYGEHLLYTVKTTINLSGKQLDEKTLRIGLREMKVSRQKDQWGQEFAFQVNGIKIFSMGANYIPEDCVYPWITRERQAYLLDCAVLANYNSLRIWGGGYYPSDEFYDMCDERGLIVWQDLMYACNVYDLTPEFIQNIEEETKDNVKRLRHHAALGMWCGNNEMEAAWLSWEETKYHSLALKKDYLLQFEYILPNVVKKYDKQTFYWPSSPCSGGSFDDPENPDIGDTHYWKVWHGMLPFSDYRNHYFRFCSEFGFQSFPSMKTIQTYAEEADWNIFSDIMESHQKNPAANGKILYYLSENFRYPKSLEDLVYISQVMQGMAIRTGVEHWRRNRGRCMGSIYWQFNDDWPVASWSSVDYYGRWKALHYMAADFYAPLSGSLVREDHEIQVWMANETRQACQVRAVLTLKTLQFEILDQQIYEETVEALSAKQLGVKQYEKLTAGLEKECFVECSFIYSADGRSTSFTCTEIFVPFKYLKLQKPEITIACREKESEYEILLTANTYAPLIQLDFKHWDGIFEDNYFDLTNSEMQIIHIQKKDIRFHGQEKARFLEEIQIKTIKDTYS